MAGTNHQDIQYQILQEAHETASQLSASQSQEGLGVTVVEVQQEGQTIGIVEDSMDAPNNNAVTVAQLESQQVVSEVASSSPPPQTYQTFTTSSQPMTHATQIITSNGRIVTIQQPVPQTTIDNTGTIVMAQDISSPNQDSATESVENVSVMARDIARELIPSSPQMVGMQKLQVPTGQDSSADIPEMMACLVCGDRGSGYHYSVFSCEGCKGFFKRTVQKNLVYNCKDDQNCDVNKFTRNSCQYCRFRKCLEHGMKREAVREDRTPGGKHRHKRLRTEESLVLPNEAVDEVMLGKLVDARPDLIPSADDVTVRPDGTPQLDVNSLMQYGYMELRLIIEWARKVPGFSELLIEDQMALLKSSFMELNVLRLAFRSLDNEGLVKFAQGIVMSPEACQQLGWGKDLVTCTLEFVRRLQEINIDNTEFCILNAVVLTYPDAAGVQDKGAVIKLQCKILETFRKYSINRYPMEPRRYGKMLLRLPSLRTISAIAAERFLSMSLDGSIKMNALVLEMMS